MDQGTRRLYVVFDPVQVLAASEDLDAELVPLEDEPLFQARSLDGQRRVAAPSMVEFEGGPWAVRVTAPDDIRLSTGERWLIGVQLALGTVVALLALGGLLAEHRALHRRATTDGLTDLPNRAEFERRAGDLLGRLGRDGRPACLFLIDLDHFKIVNDTVGHDAGDRVLVDVAQRLRQAVRSSDLVGRWGGDEFVVLMPGIGDPRAVPARAATIANALAAAPAIGAITPEASVGAALFPAHGQRLDDLMRHADRAMYAAKVQCTTSAAAGRRPVR
jgi:diguanylate cyclase (GGDEF)-like protein